MLEALISSRIRRALVEHILRDPADRFYLRGLAKELGLSITPLRRELKRFERSGLLCAVQEGNMLFYTVNTASQTFAQLQQVAVVQPLAGRRAVDAPQGALLAPGPVAPAPAPMPPVPRPVRAIPIGVVSAGASGSWWAAPLSPRLLVGVTGAGLAVMVLIAGLLYFSVSQGRTLSAASQALTARRGDVTVVVPPAAASAAMRGSRWQIVPGGMGGFSAGESY